MILTRWKPQTPPAINHAAISPRFEALGVKVQDCRSRIRPDRLEDVDDDSAHITDCNVPIEDDGAAIVKIDGIEYRYRNPATGEDTYCVYLEEPERRALTADEGRIFMQALGCGFQ